MEIKNYKDLPEFIRIAMCLNSDSFIIDGEYHTLYTIDELLSKIKKAIKKLDIDPAARRTVGIIDKVCVSSNINYGTGLVSLYLNTYCKREKDININIDQSKLQEAEFNDAPQNIDYNFDFLSASISGKHLLEKGYLSQCVVSREHKQRGSNPTVDCQECNGTGYIRCSTCHGSGRERYIDGYYASGEERIRMGMCSECQGKGVVPCPNCNGLGKIEIFADKYSIVKSIDEFYSQAVESVFVSPWRLEYIPCFNWDYTEEDKPDYLYSREMHNSLFIQKATFNEENIRILNKSRDEIVTDNSEKIIEKLNDIDPSLPELYNQGLEFTEREFEELKRGDIVARMEQHYAIPMSQLRFVFRDGEICNFYIMPTGSDKMQVTPCWIPNTGVIKYIFYKLK